MTAPLVRGEGLTRAFHRRGGLFSRGVPMMALRGVDIELRRGEAVGVVGESGCGKSTLGRVLLRLMEPTGGRVLFEERDLATLSAAELRALRRRMQMVFQDPYGSLDPRRTVGAQIADGMVIHGLAQGAEAAARVAALLRQVGLDAGHATRLPHEFSGGQRQRISIARALATRPRFLICDEPTSALDVSVQAQILNLLKDLQQELGLTMLFISHDLPVIRQMCDRIGVMQHGHLVEVAETEKLFTNAEHEYSRKLISLMPEFKGMSREGLEIAS